jgi:LmbE family N-acetylglucosaminyl deacetylase
MGTDKGVMIQESEIVPYHLSHPQGERIVVLAPHPDDETLGCGGAVRLLIGTRKKVKVVFLTSGDKGDPDQEAYPIPGCSGQHGGTRVTDYALMREREAEKALGVLGVSEYEFLRFPDRGIHGAYKDVLQRLLKIVEEFAPDAIYAPSMVELNPDHRAAAALSMEIQRRYMRSSADSDSPAPIRIVFYEITTPLRPNILVDITSVYGRKKRALKRYRSQLRLKNYLDHITALNTLRAVTVNGPRYVEAFWSIDRPLSEENIADWLSYRAMLVSP